MQLSLFLFVSSFLRFANRIRTTAHSVLLFESPLNLNKPFKTRSHRRSEISKVTDFWFALGPRCPLTPRPRQLAPRNAFPPLRAHRPRPPPAYCLSASRADLDRPLPHALTTQHPLASSLYFPCPLLPRSHPHAARMFSSLPRRRLLTVSHPQ